VKEALNYTNSNIEAGRNSHSNTEETNKFIVAIIKNQLIERERDFVSRRISDGLRYRIKTGRGWGKPPIGYTFNKDTKIYEIDKSIAWVIPAIDRMYLELGIGVKAIANELNDISVSPDGKRWNPSFVYSRLISKAFHGVMEKTLRDGETISIENIYPILRTEETWWKIQEVRKRRSNL
jgi:site-specific DNA recombinase